MVEIGGEILKFSDAAKVLGVKANTLLYRKRRGWSNDEIVRGSRDPAEPKHKLWPYRERIRKDRMRGMSLVELAEKYDSDTGSMSRFCRRIGIELRLTTRAVDPRDVFVLRKAGFSSLEIADQLGVSPGCICSWLVKYGFEKLPNKKLSKEEVATRAKRGSAWKQNKNRKLRKYRRDNRERLSKMTKERRKSDPLFRLKERFRAVTRNAFRRKGFSKGTQSEEVLGCSWDELKERIESQFKDGMGWHNMSEWHVDHIIPLAAATTEDELRKLCAYTNLQPLWSWENMSKGAKMPDKTNEDESQGFMALCTECHATKTAAERAMRAGKLTRKTAPRRRGPKKNSA